MGNGMPDLDLNFNRYLAPTLVRRLYGAMVAILVLSGGSALVVGTVRCVGDAIGSNSEPVSAEAIQRCVYFAEQDRMRQLGSPAERIAIDPDPSGYCTRELEHTAKKEVRVRLPVDIGETLGALVTCLLLGIIGRVLLELAIVQFRISETLDRIARRWEA